MSTSFQRFNALLPTVLLLAIAPAIAQGQGPTINLDPLAAASGVHPGDSLDLALRVTLGEGWHMNAHKPLDEFLVPTELKLQPQDNATVEAVVYPEPQVKKFAFSPDKMAVYEREFAVGVRIHAAAIAPGAYTLKGTLHWQACNDKTCWMPQESEVTLPFNVVAPNEPVTPQHANIFSTINFAQAAEPAEPAAQPAAPQPAPTETTPAETDWRAAAEGFKIAGRNSGYLDSASFIQWIDDVEAGNNTSELGMLEGKSIWAVLLITFLGGLALNLTPCVLPLIPINLAIIGAGAQAGSRSRGFTLGALYGAGIALVYGILGLVVVLGTGTFGALNASPWFNVIIAVVFVALGLAMFDLFLIDFSRFQGKLNLAGGKRGSLLLAFGMGCIIALLAGACVAPVVIAVVLFSRDLYAQGSVAALALPFVLGLGMALPWPFAGAGLSFLPKPGKWMERVKYAFGVLILAFAAYYGWEAFTLFRDQYFVDKEAVLASTQDLDEEGWTSSLAEGLAKAKAENKPVFIDFWATWCKSCLAMNKTTFKDAAVQERLKNYVKIKYQAEFPGKSPAKEVLDHYEVNAGLPSYRVLQPQ